MKNGFVDCTDHSDDDKLFELPNAYINFGYEWSISKRDDNGYKQFHVKTYKLLHNKFVGEEQMYSHNCFRIDFNGTVVRTNQNGDYISTENATVSGSYWIDKQSGILISVVSETVYQDFTGRHPGAPNLKGEPASTSKTTVKYFDN